MVRRSTWIILAIFVLLLGFTWLYQRNNINGADQSTITPTIATIVYGFVYDIADNSVNEVEISASSGEKIKYILNSESGLWSISNLPEEQVDSILIGYSLENLFSLKAKETLNQAPPFEAIGLVSPAYEITMQTSDGRVFITNVGSKIPIGNGYYIRVNTGPVRIIDESAMDEVLKLLINPLFISSPSPEIPVIETALPTTSGLQTTQTP